MLRAWKEADKKKAKKLLSCINCGKPEFRNRLCKDHLKAAQKIANTPAATESDIPSYPNPKP